jgi:hypothetical protein
MALYWMDIGITGTASNIRLELTCGCQSGEYTWTLFPLNGFLNWDMLAFNET